MLGDRQPGGVRSECFYTGSPIVCPRWAALAFRAKRKGWKCGPRAVVSGSIAHDGMNSHLVWAAKYRCGRQEVNETSNQQGMVQLAEAERQGERSR